MTVIHSQRDSIFAGRFSAADDGRELVGSVATTAFKSSLGLAANSDGLNAKGTHPTLKRQEERARTEVVGIVRLTEDVIELNSNVLLHCSVLMIDFSAELRFSFLAGLPLESFDH